MKALLLDEIIDDLPTLLPKIKTLVSLLKSSKNPIIFTGAGVSTSAGVPDYRSSYKTLLKTGPGVWESEENKKKYNGIPVIKAAIETYPTKSHMAMKSLIDKGIVSQIITQNVDNLHLRSGINEDKIIELHGNICKEFCEKCQKVFYRDFYVKTPKFSDPLNVYTSRNCNFCQGKLRKTLVHFGEKVPEEKLNKCYDIIKNSDFCLCFGTSFRVNPAGKIPKIFTKEKGKKLGIVNLQKTFFEDQANLVINGYCDDVCEAMMREMGIEIEEFQVRKTFVLDFFQEDDKIVMKIQGKLPGEINKDFYNLQEIEISELPDNQFIKKKSDDGSLESVILPKKLKSFKLCVKFFGNSFEPNAVIKLNLENVKWNGNSLKMVYDLKLENFLKEWSIHRYLIN